MINYIFGLFFIVGILYSLFNNIDISNEILLSSKNSIDIILSILPVICLWLGIMNIAKKSGLLDKLSIIIRPILRIIFPEIERDDIVFSYIGINIIMNILGLGSAATPFGLKAIKRMQEINDKKDTASRSMITFLVMNTASITIMPTTIIALHLKYNNSNAGEIIPYIFIVSILSCTVGLLIDRLFYIRKKT